MRAVAAFGHRSLLLHRRRDQGTPCLQRLSSRVRVDGGPDAPCVKYERGSGFLDGLRNSKLHRTVLRIPITRTAASPLDGQKPRGARRRSQNSDCDSGRGLAFRQVGQAPDRRDFGHVISINLPHQGSRIFNASKKSNPCGRAVYIQQRNTPARVRYDTTPSEARPHRMGHRHRDRSTEAERSRK